MTRKNSQNSQNNPTNIMYHSNRRNSTASDPGITYNVVGSKNWRTNRPNTKNTTLKNIRNRVKAKNAASLARMLNQKYTPNPMVPNVKDPKMATPSIFSKVKNIYNAAKFRFQTKKRERTGINLLTKEQKPNMNDTPLHSSYTNDPAINGINAEYNWKSSTRPGAGFVY